MTLEEHDVVVVGAGPTGLLLACELRLAGIDVLVLERLTDPDPTIKAGSITLPTASAFDRRGLLPDLVAAQDRGLATARKFLAANTAPAPTLTPATNTVAGPGASAATANTSAANPGTANAGGADFRAGKSGTAGLVVPPKFLGHFGALMLIGSLLDEDDPDFGGYGPAADVGMVSQQEVESILAARAAALGVEIRRGTSVTTFETDDDGVTIDGTIRAGWLVGCDGGRSVVRKTAGFDFPGTPPQITAYQALAEMTDTDGLRRGWNRSARGVYAFGPIPGRILVVEFGGAPADRDTPVTVDELQAAVRRVTGVDVTVTGIRSVTRFTDNARQATDYRRGRVLLAGDAAHVHSPFGGQGLNLGIGDAMNLGWKLAATISGRAPAGLLDTYTAERHPIGAQVLAWTRAQVAIMRSDPWADALRDLVGGLIGTTDGTTYIVKRLWGVTHRYGADGGHPLVGTLSPDFALSDGSRLADHSAAGTGVLLDLADDESVRAAADGYPELVRVVTGTASEHPNLAAVLVRPDGVVAWATDRPSSPTGLTEAMATWFG